MSSYSIPQLPLKTTFESVAVLKQLTRSTRQLAELKGVVQTIPNERILTNTLILREARQSSAVENIITTQDELFRADIKLEGAQSSATKEVLRYAGALRYGFELVQQKGVVTLNIVNEIQRQLEQNNAGIRRTPGTTLKNSQTGEVVYTPPQHADIIADHMANLLAYFNDPILSEEDPLIKMAVIHHQFESIHPYYDGNGRTGRILNILYLVQERLLGLPILYLSGYIIQTKGDYYRLLQAVRDTDDWESWILYLLRGIEQTAQDSIRLVTKIRELMRDYKQQIRTKQPKIYSQDLLNNIFRHPYTKVDAVVNDLNIHRNTAAGYLQKLVHSGLLSKHNSGRMNYYVNDRLVKLLADNAG